MNMIIVDDEVTALRDLARVLKKVVPDASVEIADEAERALDLIRGGEYFDVAFVDINMPGKDGLTLANEMKLLQPMLNIVMVTAYPQYALDAMKLYVSDYILKPAAPEDIRRALANLRNPVSQETGGLYVRCFGNFEVFCGGEIVKFGRSKAKELFAYLIDRNGAAATNAECCAVLWGDVPDSAERQRHYFHQIWADLKSTLGDISCEGVLRWTRNAYSVDTAAISCDYYLALQRDPLALSRFTGEYMSQYEWAEGRIGVISDLKDKFLK